MSSFSFFSLIILSLVKGLGAQQPLLEGLNYHDRIGLIPGAAGHVEKLFNSPKLLRSEDGKPVTGEEKKKKMGVGTEIYQGDKIITPDGSKVHMRFRDRTYVEIAPDSAFMPERVRRGADRDNDRKDESIYRFYYGFLRMTALSVESYVRFYVKYADKTLLVEGPSDFFLTLHPKTDDLIIHVRKGSVWCIFALANTQIKIPEGESRRIRKDGKGQPLTKLSPENEQKLRSITKIQL